MKTKYRTVFAPDGEHYIDSAKNDTTDPLKAVMDARELCRAMPTTKAKVINPETRFVIWDSEIEVKNYPAGWIATARKKALDR